MYILRKCSAPKTGLRPVSIQVQLVSYQCQHGHRRLNYQSQTTGHNLFSYQCQRGHKRVNYQCQTTGHDLTAINVNTDTSE